MIKLIEALNFRCLRYIRQPLDRFHVLVGPNASGKTTFLDVVAFLGRLISDGLEAAVLERTSNFKDLLWARQGENFELAIEAVIPEEKQRAIKGIHLDTIRYEVAIGINPDTKEINIEKEKVILKKLEQVKGKQLELFPNWPGSAPKTIITSKIEKTERLIVDKIPGGLNHFYSEVSSDSGKDKLPSFQLGPRRSALANLPEDESRFPISTWFKGFLGEGIKQLILNSLLIRQASRPGQGRGFRPDGSTLPWVIENLLKNHPDHFQRWIRHLQTAFPDIETIKTIERSDDRHCYLVICYRGGLEVPSWMVSDGTLRLLALTLPAYLPELSGVYLIEEPENGIHPRAVETALQSLSSVYNAQILMASHSPVILSLVDAKDVLCFARTPGGETDIVRGPDHPRLKDWTGEANLGVLFAGGVLG